MWRILLILVLYTAVPGPAVAGDTIRSGAERVALVELFTSEGCSSCPPADRWISGLVESPRLWREVVPIAFHVDYWDYIGWPDRFASPEYGRRQSDYRRSGNTQGVYTPGFVVGGREWRGWFRDPNLEALEPLRVGTLTVEVDEGLFEATFEPAVDVPERLVLNIAVLGFGLRTEVKAGENHGRMLEHDFVVLGWRQLGLDRNDGQFRGRGELPAARVEAPRLGIAAWVSPRGNPSPIQAAGGWLK